MKKAETSWRKLKRAARAFMQEYNVKGQEVPDGTRNEVALTFRRPRDIHEMIQDALRGERMANAAHMQGLESFEEANDFDVDEEPDPLSPYELREMHDELYDSDRRALAAERRKNGTKEAGTRRERASAGDSSTGTSGTVAREEDGEGHRTVRERAKASERRSRDTAREDEDRLVE